MADVGRPTVLNDELKLKIRELILEGATADSIAESLGVPVKTYNGWIYRNYEDLQATVRQARHDRYLNLSEENIEPLLRSADERVRADMTKHVQETLGKRWFSKRSELTGAEGKPLIVAGEIAAKHDIGDAAPGTI